MRQHSRGSKEGAPRPTSARIPYAAKGHATLLGGRSFFDGATGGNRVAVRREASSAKIPYAAKGHATLLGGRFLTGLPGGKHLPNIFHISLPFCIKVLRILAFSYDLPFSQITRNGILPWNDKYVVLIDMVRG